MGCPYLKTARQLIPMFLGELKSVEYVVILNEPVAVEDMLIFPPFPPWAHDPTTE
jgi:hypothetical protein